MKYLSRLALYVNAVGLRAAFRFRVAKVQEYLAAKKWIATSREPVRIQIKGYAHPIWMRVGTSDLHVFYQLFVMKEYDFDMGIDRDQVRLIVDCGANVGYTSVFMLNKFPNARVIAIEPDPDNLEVCRKNLAPYGSRVEVIRAGVWSHETNLKLVRPEGRDFEWGIQVKEAAPGEPADLFATSIPAILERSGASTIDLLKVDIEGSEEVVFAKDWGWLDHVKTIAIELHGQKRADVFFRAMGDYHYDKSISGELTVCTGIAPIAAHAAALAQPSVG
ncbi:FkbM family methyltransferase [Isosphaeraceae bacterium EP7]